MKTADLRFRTRGEFMAYYLEDVNEGGILWPSDEAVNINETVKVQVRFAGYHEQWDLFCDVVWRHARPPGRPELPEGVGLAVSEQSLLDMGKLLAFCTDKNSDQGLYRNDERTELRFDVPYLVEYLHQRKLMRAQLSNISESGCFISTPQPLPPETRVVFFMYRPKRPRPWVLEGEVRWVRRESDKPGMGVKLLFDMRRHKGEVKLLIRNLAKGEEAPFDELDEHAYSTDFLSSSDWVGARNEPGEG